MSKSLLILERDPVRRLDARQSNPFATVSSHSLLPPRISRAGLSSDPAARRCCLQALWHFREETHQQRQRPVMYIKTRTAQTAKF